MIDAVLLSHVLQRECTERKELLCPYHVHTLRSLRTPWFGGYRIHHAKVVSPSTIRVESLKKFDDQLTPNTTFIAIRSPQEELGADPLYGGYENVILRMEFQE